MIVKQEWTFDPARGKDASDYEEPTHETKSKLKQNIREAAENLGADVEDVTLKTEFADYTENGYKVDAKLQFEVALHGFWDSEDNPRPESQEISQELEDIGLRSADYTVTSK